MKMLALENRISDCEANATHRQTYEDFCPVLYDNNVDFFLGKILRCVKISYSSLIPKNDLHVYYAKKKNIFFYAIHCSYIIFTQ